MRYPAYPRYKPSDIEWLGDVPQHWEVNRLKNLASYRVSNVDKIPSEDELPIRLCNYTDVYNNDFITPDFDLMETTATVDEIRRFGLQKGDVVITKDSEDWRDIAVPALVTETAPDFVCGYHLAILRSHRNVLCGGYLLRAFQSIAINHQFQLAASGVTRFGLPKSSIGESYIPLPNPAEQKAIAAFLDHETGRIDSLVAKKRELIERLKEKRTALISQTVTRGLPPDAARAAGLDPYPKLKPSGIEWLGDIPEHWGKAKKLSRLASSLKHSFVNGPFGSDLLTTEISDEGVPVIYIRDISTGCYKRTSEGCVSQEKSDELNFCKVNPGDVLIAKVGDPPGIAVVYPKSEPTGIVTQDVIRIRVNRLEVSASYLVYYLNSTAGCCLIDQIAIESTRMRVSLADYKNSRVILPPLSEQTAIVAFLDSETDKLDALIAKVEEAIERLQEYRTALITAAVTGKIDVRGVVEKNDGRGGRSGPGGRDGQAENAGMTEPHTMAEGLRREPEAGHGA